MNNELLALMSDKLLEKLIHEEAFNLAYEKNFLMIKNGVLISRFGEPFALAYFCGRAFCNDKPKKVLKRRVWVKGNREFPAKELNALFRKKDLRELRRNHLDCEIPDWFEDIDNLFIECSKRQ